MGEFTDLEEREKPQFGRFGIGVSAILRDAP